MKYTIIILSVSLLFSSCQSKTNSQSKINVGGPCEGCEAILEYGDKKLTPIDTLPAFNEYEPKLKITGTVFEKDGKTPANNIILYIYHTNRDGIYEKKGNETGWGKRHGYIRGWVKTEADGKYTFYTFRPAAYPNGREAEHVHIIAKEPDKNEYYLEDFLFNDDELLTQEKRTRLKNRGGSGIVQPKMENGILTIKRNIVLGLNIPDY